MRTLLVAGAQLVAVAAALLSTYSTKIVVQAVATGDRRQAVIATTVLAGTAALAVVAQLVSTFLSQALAEAVGLLIDAESIRLSATLTSLEHQNDPRFADQLELIRTERTQLADAMRTIVFNLRWIVMLVGTLALLARIDGRFLMLPLFALPRAYATQAAKRLTKRAQERTTEAMRLRARLYARAASPSGARELRLFDLTAEILRRTRALSTKVQQIRGRAAWAEACRLGLGDLLFMAAGAVAFGLAVTRAAAGTLSAGELVLAGALITSMMTLMTSAMQSSGRLVGTVLAAERYQWLQDFVTARASVATGLPPKRLQSGIDLDNVEFRYPRQHSPTLRDVSLKIPQGQVVALVGGNGAGKSTLVNLLCGFYMPTSGRLTIDGQDLEKIAPAEWHQRISVLVQDFTNFEVRLDESVSIGDLASSPNHGRIVDAIRRAGGGNLLDLLPEGIQSMLGKRWGGLELSGGQWQTLALSRAILREHPLLLILDEPAASLDPLVEHAIFERITATVREGRANGRCTVLISHRLLTTRMADIIFVMADGRIVEQGTHTTLLAQKGPYAELYGLHARAYQ